MNRYRSLDTIHAVQYEGQPITGVTCHGTAEEVQVNGCDPSRKQHTHVHTAAVGGMTVLKPTDWIFPVTAGPFGVASDTRFRASWEVPAPDARAGATETEAAAEVPIAPAMIEELAKELPSPADTPVVSSEEPKAPAVEKVQNLDTNIGGTFGHTGHVGEAGE